MDQWFMVLWVVIGIAVPVIALVTARSLRMKRRSQSALPAAHRPHEQHRRGH